MNYLKLRSLLRPVVGEMKDRGPDRLIPELCESIGLPIPDEGGSKRDRMYAAFGLPPKRSPLSARFSVAGEWSPASEVTLRVGHEPLRMGRLYDVASGPTLAGPVTCVDRRLPS